MRYVTHMLRYLITGLLVSIVASLLSCGGRGGSNSGSEGSGSVQPPSPGGSVSPGVNNPSAGCSANTGLLTESGAYTFQFNNIERGYRVHIPENYESTSASPLVMLCHGW